MQRNTRLELELGGQVRPLLFDFTFLDFLIDEVPLAEVDELGRTRPWRLMPIVALAALRSGADFEGKKLDKSLDLKAVTGWIQEADPLDVNRILECYKTAMGFIGAVINGKAESAES